MYSKAIRIILILAYIGIGLMLLSVGNLIGVVLFAVAGVTFYAGIKYGSVGAAWKALRKGKFDKAKRMLEETKKPERLAKGVKGYYYLIWGYVNIYEKQYDTAVDNFNKTLEVGLKTKNDEAIVHFKLALIYMAINQVDLAEQYLQKAKELDPKQQLIEKIEHAEKVLHNKNKDGKKKLKQFLEEEGF